MRRIKKKWCDIPIVVKISIAFTVCGILQRCLSFITLPLFTRLLTTEQYGEFTVYQSWSGILSIFITLNLAYGSFSTAMIKYENDRNGYISAVEGIFLAFSLIFFAIYLPFRNLWNQLFELPTEYVCIMIAEILGVNAIQLWSGKNRFEYKYVSVVIITLLMSILSPVTAFILVTTSTEKGFARILGYAIISIAVGGIFFVYYIFKGKQLLKKEYWKYALGFNVPLLAYYLSQSIFNQSDRIMISHMVGKDKAAIYGVAYSLAMLMTFVLNAINNAYLPWFYTKIKEGNSDNKRISLIISGVLASLLLIVIWFAPEIIWILAGEEYVEAVHVVPPVAISLLLLFYAQVFIDVEFYYEEKKKLVYASIIAAVTNIVLNLLFINIMGYMAAAYTTLFSYIIFAIANYIAMRKTLKEKHLKDNLFNYKGMIYLFGLFVLVSYLGVFCFEYIYLRIVIFICFLIILLIKRKKVTKALNIQIKKN